MFMKRVSVPNIDRYLERGLKTEFSGKSSQTYWSLPKFHFENNEILYGQAPFYQKYQDTPFLAYHLNPKRGTNF